MFNLFQVGAGFQEFCKINIKKTCTVINIIVRFNISLIFVKNVNLKIRNLDIIIKKTFLIKMSLNFNFILFHFIL